MHLLSLRPSYVYISKVIKMIKNDNHATEILSPAIAGGAAAVLSKILLANSPSSCVCYWNMRIIPTIVPRIL